VDDAGIGPLPHLLGEDLVGVRLGLAGVDDDRQAGLAGGGDVGPEAGALPVAVRMVVMEIEATLADPDDPLVPRPVDEGRRLHVGMGVGLVGMDADGGPDVALALGKADHLVPFGLAGRDVEHRADAGRPSPLQHRLLLLDQALVVEMAMAVGEHSAP
jgi:hypothetical protein